MHSRQSCVTPVRIHVMKEPINKAKRKRQSRQGQPVWKISDILNVSQRAVTKTLKCYKKTSSHEDQHRKRIPRVTSAAADVFICVSGLRTDTLAAPEIRAQKMPSRVLVANTADGMNQACVASVDMSTTTRTWILSRMSTT